MYNLNLLRLSSSSQSPGRQGRELLADNLQVSERVRVKERERERERQTEREREREREREGEKKGRERERERDRDRVNKQYICSQIYLNHIQQVHVHVVCLNCTCTVYIQGHDRQSLRDPTPTHLT